MLIEALAKIGVVSKNPVTVTCVSYIPRESNWIVRVCTPSMLELQNEWKNSILPFDERNGQGLEHPDDIIVNTTRALMPGDELYLYSLGTRKWLK